MPVLTSTQNNKFTPVGQKIDTPNSELHGNYPPCSFLHPGLSRQSPSPSWPQVLNSSRCHDWLSSPSHISQTPVETIFKRRHETAPLARERGECRTRRHKTKCTTGSRLHICHFISRPCRHPLREVSPRHSTRIRNMPDAVLAVDQEI